MEEKIKDFLKKINFNISWEGYRYWTSAIMYAFTVKDYKMRDVYKFIAKKHKTSYSKAERAMRYAINNSNAKELLNKSFSNSLFLALTVENVL